MLDKPTSSLAEYLGVEWLVEILTLLPTSCVAWTGTSHTSSQPQRSQVYPKRSLKDEAKEPNGAWREREYKLSLRSYAVVSTEPDIP